MWNQWASAAPPMPTAAAPVAPPLPNAPPPGNTGAAPMIGPMLPTAANAAGTMDANNPYGQYTAAQFAAMTPEQQYAVQQHWQQWQTYQQEYAKWHAQYGEQYKREMEAATAAATQIAAVAGATAATATSFNNYQQLSAAATVSQTYAPLMSVMQQPPPPPPPDSNGHKQKSQPSGRITGQPQVYTQPPPSQSVNQNRQSQQQQQWPPPLMNFNQPPPSFNNSYGGGNNQQQSQGGNNNDGYQQGNNNSHDQGGRGRDRGRNRRSKSNSKSNDRFSNNSGGGSSADRNFNQMNPGMLNTWNNNSNSFGPDQQNRGNNNNFGTNQDGGRGGRCGREEGSDDASNQNPFRSGNNNNAFGASNRRNQCNNSNSELHGNGGGFGPNQSSQNSWSGGNNSNNSFNNSTGDAANNWGPNGPNNNWNNNDSSNGSGNMGNRAGRNSGNNTNNNNNNSNRMNDGNWNNRNNNFGGNQQSNRWGGNNNNNQRGGNFGSNTNNNHNSNRWSGSNSGNFGNMGDDSNTNLNNNVNFRGTDSNDFDAQRGTNAFNANRNFNNQGSGSGSGGPMNRQNQQRPNAPELDEESFDRQFRQWEQQFDDWKLANANHPDREMYKRYEQEFEKQRQRIMERREQMRRRKMEQIGASAPPTNVGSEQLKRVANAWNNQKPPPPPPPPASARSVNCDKALPSASCTNNPPERAHPLGKRKSRFNAAEPEPAAVTPIVIPDKVDTVTVISLDDDSDADRDDSQQVAVEPIMTDIFKKSDGIPGLDLVEDGTDKSAMATGRKQLVTDVVVLKEDGPTRPAKVAATARNQSKPQQTAMSATKPKAGPRNLTSHIEEAANSSAIPNIAAMLQDPTFMHKISDALAKAQGKESIDAGELPPAQFIEQLPVLLQQLQSQQADSGQQGQPEAQQQQPDDKPLSFAEWQRRKGGMSSGSGSNNSKCISISNERQNRECSADISNNSSEPFGQQQLEVNFSGPPNGPAMFQGNLSEAGNNKFDGAGPESNLRDNGPNMGCNGPNFGGGNRLNGPPNSAALQGPNFGGNRNNFGGPGNGSNFRGNGPNFHNSNGPDFNNFGPNFGGNGSNFQGRGGPNFGGRNFNGPNGPFFDNNGGRNMNHNDGPNFNGDTEQNMSGNPFRRGGGPSMPNFDNNGNPRRQNFNQGNNFGANDRSTTNNDSWNKGPGYIGGNNKEIYDGFYRPMQVFDYQNSTRSTAKVIDYGHKAATEGATTAINVLPEEFKPMQTFEYGHAPRQHAGANVGGPASLSGMLQRRNNKNKNKNKNKKLNAAKQALGDQPNQPAQSQQPQTPIAGIKAVAVTPPTAATATPTVASINGNQPESVEPIKESEQTSTTAKTKITEKAKEDLEEISDTEDALLEEADKREDNSSPPPPPPPLMFSGGHLVLPVQSDCTTAIFPSTAAANQNLPKVTTSHLQIALPLVENRNTVTIDEILMKPSRQMRPKKICIIIRGPPGSGKSHVAKLIKEKETEMGGANPRILSIDDYFLIENDYEDKCPKTGKKIPKKEILYEYDAQMEQTYMQCLIKSFKKTISDNLYDFIIVDCNNNALRTLNEFYCHAKESGFMPYVVDLLCDADICLNRNVHQRSAKDINAIIAQWKPTPLHYIKLDVTSLVENVVEMEDAEDMVMDSNTLDSAIAESNDVGTADVIEVASAEENAPDVDEDDSNEAAGICDFLKSKWETENTNENLARLDGTNRLLQKRKAATMEDFLQTDEWEPPKASTNGKKRVRWADIEEKRAQDKMRAIGFVVGQTDWKRMMDPNAGTRALNKTKYIERINKQRH